MTERIAGTWPINRAILSRIKKIADDLGAKLVIVYISSHDELLPFARTGTKEGHVFSKQIIQWARANAAFLTNIAEALNAQIERGRKKSIFIT